MQLIINKKKVLILIIIAGIIIFVYKAYNPLNYKYFPKCPFKQITGYKCAGCGSQRAVHYLLNLEVKKAFRENMLLVISIPYLLLGFFIEMYPKPGERLLKWRKRLYGTKAIFVILIIIISFWILRNIYGI